MVRPFAVALVVIAGFLASCSVRAEEIFGLTAGGSLVRFDSAKPGTLISTVTITGVVAGETILGIDFRVQTGQLFAIGNAGRTYVINAATGVATVRGTAPFTPAPSGTKFGIDFNPTVDLIRFVSDNGQNLRINPNTGVTQGTDLTLAYVTGDVNAGTAPKIVGAAYTNNFGGSSATTLYDIDSGTDSLVTQGSLNGTISPNGTGVSAPLFTVGKLGVDTTDDVGFDVSGSTGTAYASLTTTGETTSKLYTINLFTGTATLLGGIGATDVIRDISVVPAPFAFDAVVSTGTRLHRFEVRNPTITQVSNNANGVLITGLQTGETILGIDYRPRDNQMYGLGSTSRIYNVNPVTGIATQVGTTPFTPALSGTNFGFDFNPTVDRIRVTSNTGQNLRLNPVDGTVAATDTNLNPGTPNVVASAYSNNVDNATTTVLYDIDLSTNQLMQQNPPNAGTLVPVGPIAGASATAGFDIFPNGNAYAVFGSQLVTVTLTTGGTTNVGLTTIGSGLGGINGLALVNNQPTITLSAATFTVIEKNSASVTLTRSNSTGTATVDFVTTDGTAKAGTDYTASSQTVTFVDGESTRTVFIPALDDTTLELFETVSLTIRNPVGAVLGTQTTATLNIADKDDHDGDGFTNEIETAFGSSPTDANSTPFSGKAAGASTPLTLDKVQIKLSFDKSGSDNISVMGKLTVPDGTSLSGLSFILNLGGPGGVVKTFTLDAKGKSPKGNDSVSVAKPKGGSAKFSVKLGKQDFASKLAKDNLDGDEDVSKSDRTLLVNVYFNSTKYETTAQLLYSAKKGKSGSASLKKIR